MVCALAEAGDGMGEPDVEFGIVAIKRHDLEDQLVLLVLQHVGKFQFVLQLVEVELGDRLAGRSEEHKSELQSLLRISYADFCLTKIRQKHMQTSTNHTA